MVEYSFPFDELSSQQGHEDVVMFLLNECSARVNITDKKHGFSPVEVAATDAIGELLGSDLDTSVPRRLEKAAHVTCANFGTLQVTWSSRGVDQAKSLAVSGFVVQVLRSEEQIFSDSESSEEPSSDEDEDEASAARRRRKGTKAEPGAVLQEMSVAGTESCRAEFFRITYPFHVQARVAAANASGRGDWGPLSESILCTSIPSVLEPPRAICLSKTSVKVSWCKPEGNGCKIIAYKLEAREKDPSAPYSSSSSSSAPREWGSIGVFPAKVRETTIDRLRPGMAFQFRIICSNELGKSKPGPPSVPLKTVGSAWGSNGSETRSTRKK